jgi:hypothetical protein
MTELIEQRRQRIREILVFAAPESVASHDDPRAIAFFLEIERGEGIALLRRQKARQYGIPVSGERTLDANPVVDIWLHGAVMALRDFHAANSKASFASSASSARLRSTPQR